MKLHNLVGLSLLMVWGQVGAIFYLPDGPARSFGEGAFSVMVNKLTSTQTQLPLDYYSLPFCRPHAEPVHMAMENMGQLLSGDLIQNSPYILLMKQDMFCKHVCIAEIDETVVDAIEKEYHHNWIVDNLPAASKMEDENTITTRYWQGFPVGYLDSHGEAYIYNHVNIEIMYHKVDDHDDDSLYRIVRFYVEPFSIKHKWNTNKTANVLTDLMNPIESCSHDGARKVHTDWDMVNEEGREPQEANGPVLFTYDVIWIENRYVQWSNRWDVYLTMDQAIPQRVHWFSIMNSVIIAVIVLAVILCMLKRMMRDMTSYRTTNGQGQPELVDKRERCLARCMCFFMWYGFALVYFLWERLTGKCQLPMTTTEGEIRGFKAVQADVFRPPRFAPMLLSAACGTGAQLLCTAFITILISAVGLISPARSGSLIMTEIILFVLMGPVSGYVTARFYSAFGGRRRKLASTCAALLFPSVSVITFAVVYLYTGIDKSTYTVGYPVWAIMIALWLGVMVPLVFVGSYFGYRQKAILFPVSPSTTPREIPGSWCVRYFGIIPLSLQLVGSLPFGAIFVELYFMLASVWMHQYYYSFGFLMLVFVIMTLTTAVMTILFTYIQLYLEDWHWWWRSFNNAGAVGLFVLFYSFVYYRELDTTDLGATVLYFGFMSVVSLGLFCMMGFVGVSASLWFTKSVYAGGMDNETDQPLVSASPEVQLAVVA